MYFKLLCYVLLGLWIWNLGIRMESKDEKGTGGVCSSRLGVIGGDKEALMRRLNRLVEVSEYTRRCAIKGDDIHMQLCSSRDILIALKMIRLLYKKSTSSNIPSHSA